MRKVMTLIACACAPLLVSAQAPSGPAAPAPRPKRPGVSTPGVRIPITKLKPAAIYQVPGAPDWMSIDPEKNKGVWVSNEPRNTVSRLDPASDAVTTFTVWKAPCSGLAAGF